MKRSVKRLLAFPLILMLCLVPTNLLLMAAEKSPDDGSFQVQRADEPRNLARQQTSASGHSEYLGNYQFRVDLPALGFVSAYVDGVELARKADYSIREGSTILTLKESYVKTLKPGTHTLRMDFLAATVTIPFDADTIMDPIEEPELPPGAVIPRKTVTAVATAPRDNISASVNENANPGTGMNQDLFYLLNQDWSMNWMLWMVFAMVAVMVCLIIWALIPRKTDEIVAVASMR